MQAFRSAGFSNLLLRALNRILFVLGVQLKRSFMVVAPSAQFFKSLDFRGNLKPKSRP